MDQYVIHNMVEYIDSRDEFPFDCVDVEESIEDVLAFFGLSPELSHEERQEVKRQLLQKALAGELAEMSRLVELGTDCHLSRILQRLHPYRYRPEKNRSISPAEFVEKMHQ